MKFFFRNKRKDKKTYADKLPWVAIQNDLLEAKLWTVGSRGSSRSSSRSGSPVPNGFFNAQDGGKNGWCERCGRCGWCGRLCVVRLAQFTLLLTLVAGAAHITLGALTSSGTTPVPSPHARPRVPSLPLDNLPFPSPDTLLDLQDFRYAHDAVGVCSPSKVYFLFMVHSRPDHFRQRQAIRATWGGHKSLGDGWVARTVFMLGAGAGGGVEGDEKPPSGGGLDVEGLVEREAARHGDLVVGNFVDHYHNLTYKHVMALRWAATRCPHATFVVKSDDDAFIDVVALKSLLGRTFGEDAPPPARTLACNVLPAGTKPQRAGKWAVSTKDYPWEEYPKYCAGLAYVATPDVIDQLYRAAHADAAPRIWVDDVWVTGLLAEALQIHPHYLNLRYSYDHTEMASWAEKAKEKPNTPPPYTFAHLDPACPDWLPTLRDLWQHALVAHNTSDFKAIDSPDLSKQKTAGRASADRER